MTISPVLADKSALEQVRHSSSAREQVERLAQAGAMASCEVSAMEILYSTRNRAECDRVRGQLEAQVWLPVDAESAARALEVQALLARRGQHRLAVMDLLIAATAEVHGATVLHHDRDFDRIAAVTGQATRWIVPPGSGFGADR
ncbi:PIN domain nuclease [Aquihabitans sp. McL0605]|uniref:PIN domain nuclease n=1 Tax=Aquihabitans sp. McL0605 TaxID=3415671 RepID=UPI003CEAC3AB